MDGKTRIDTLVLDGYLNLKNDGPLGPFRDFGGPVVIK